MASLTGGNGGEYPNVGSMQLATWCCCEHKNCIPAMHSQLSNSPKWLQDECANPHLREVLSPLGNSDKPAGREGGFISPRGTSPTREGQPAGSQGPAGVFRIPPRARRTQAPGEDHSESGLQANREASQTSHTGEQAFRAPRGLTLLTQLTQPSQRARAPARTGKTSPIPPKMAPKSKCKPRTGEFGPYGHFG